MRRKLTAVVIAVFVFSLIAASAASLGGISGGSGADPELGAEANVVVACTAAGVSVELTSLYQNTEFQVDDVTLTVGDAGCDGETARVVLSSTSGTTYTSSELTGTIATDTVTIDFSGENLSAEELDYIDIAIS